MTTSSSLNGGHVGAPSTSSAPVVHTSEPLQSAGLETIHQDLMRLDEDIRKGFTVDGDIMNKILNLFLQYDKSYNADMMKEHPVE